MASVAASSDWDSVLVEITDYVFNYEIESAKAWQAAQTSLLDSIGCAIESIAKSVDCRSLLGPITPGSDVPDGFRLPGTSYRLDPLKGAFDLGTAIRYMDHNDTMGGAEWGHPSDNLGALLAVSDWLCRMVNSGRLDYKGPPLTLKTLFIAMIKAYEIQGCFQIRNAFNARGLDHIILVKLASTAIVSWLLGMSKLQTMAAISHVWMDGAALRTYRSGSNTIARKSWAAGDACMRAVQFALLTRAGQSGAKTALTMPRWGFYDTMWQGESFDLSRQFGSWAIENIFLKVIPVEGHSISAIEATLAQYEKLRARGLAEERHIARVDVRTNGAANMIINKRGDLHGAADRDHCMQYSIAVTLMKGAAPDPEDFQDSSPFAGNPAVKALRERIYVREDESFTRDYLDVNKKSVASAVSVKLCNGNAIEEVVIEYPVGHVKHPKTLQEVRRKFVRNMALMFSESEVENIVDVVEQQEGTKISAFIDLLARSQGNRTPSQKL